MTDKTLEELKAEMEARYRALHAAQDATRDAAYAYYKAEDAYDAYLKAKEESND